MNFKTTLFYINLIFSGILNFKNPIGKSPIALINEMSNDVLPNMKIGQNISIIDFNFFFSEEGLHLTGVDFIENKKQKTAMLYNAEELFAFIYHGNSIIKNDFFFQEYDNELCMKHLEDETCFSVIQYWEK